eukprot:TRINITY_DN3208_c0_g1_i1.p1 TRINITY_DN3208_c0_g1~~TRINITY_DN3208_c0_g1_i1.p1  ORF type:complete len:1398 (-),score=349.80 TRINITY_DN3208_c0_g1_i1:40-4233(-)
MASKSGPPNGKAASPTGPTEDLDREEGGREEQQAGVQKAQADYSGTSLKFYHALGMALTPGARSIEHVNDESIVYLVGKHVAIFNYENKVHRFILKNAKTSQIVAFAVSNNRRYIALSEKLMDDGGSQVSVYNFNTASRVRTLSLQYLSKQPVTALDFSRDNKYIVTTTAPPDVFIYLWQLDKARLLGMIEVSFVCTQVSISPWAHWKLCTTGTDTLKIWHFADKQLKAMDPMPKKKDYKFTCHAWFDDEKIVVGTEEGDVLVLVGENDRMIELKKTLQPMHEGHAIWSICAIGRGFVCGGDGGFFTLFERTYDQEYFQQYRRFRTHEPKHRILGISISPNEENVVLCYDNNNLVFFSLANVDILKDEDASSFRSLPIGFHADTVTAIDVCVQKSIVVTASLDKYVRVWNFLKKRLEVTKQFEEEALSVACHPTGLRVIIGFKYRMCMFNLLVNDLHLCSDFPVKNCREVRFSHGGQFFAAVIVNRILVFSTYTFECIGSLQGHSSMVKSICWIKNDTGLVSAGFEGAIYEWKLDGWKHEDTEDNVVKSTAYSCLRYDDNTGMIAAIGSNKVAEQGLQEGEVTMRQIHKGQELRMIKPGTISKHTSKTHTAEIALCTVSQTIFVGTANGQLLLYKWPLTENAQPYQRYDIHGGEILFVLMSLDEKYLFTVGADNTLFMFDVDIIVEGRAVARRSFNYAVFDDVSYVLQTELDERGRAIASLETQLEEMRRDKEFTLQQIKSDQDDERRRKEIEYTKTLNEARQLMEEAAKERDKAKVAVVENEKQLEALHMKAAEELEALYQKRTDDQNARYQQLKEERDDLIVRYENKIYKLLKQKEDEVQQLIQKHTDLVHKLQQEIEELTNDKIQTQKEHEDMFQEMCVDYEQELDTVKVQAKEKLKKETDELYTAKSQAVVFKRKFDHVNVNIKDVKLEKAEIEKQLEKQTKRVAELERTIHGLRVEIGVRNDNISTNEKKILDLKKESAELQKLRYVLTFKFNELKKEVAPKEEQIKIMNERIAEMDEELERVGIDRDALKQTLIGRDEKLHVLQSTVKKTTQQLEDKERLISLLLRELTEILAETDPKKLVFALKDVIMKYNAKYQKEDVANERDKIQEFERQRDYMEAQLSSMKKQSNRKAEHLRHDNIRKTGENALLVKEINNLRHEKKVLGTKLALTEMHLKEAKALSGGLQQGAVARSGSPLFPPAPMSRTPDIGQLDDSRRGVRVDAGDSPTRPTSKTPTGKLIKGSTRSLRDLSQMDPQKVAEIVATVERNNAEMAKQQEEIKRLREFVQHLLAREQEKHADSGTGEDSDGDALAPVPSGSNTRKGSGRNIDESGLASASALSGASAPQGLTPEAFSPELSSMTAAGPPSREGSKRGASATQNGGKARTPTLPEI